MQCWRRWLSDYYFAERRMDPARNSSNAEHGAGVRFNWSNAHPKSVATLRRSVKIVGSALAAAKPEPDREMETIDVRPVGRVFITGA